MARSKSKYDNIATAKNLRSSMQIAVHNMIEEIKKPVDNELSGSQRKAELQAIKQTAVDAKELIIEIEKTTAIINSLTKDGTIEGAKDYSSGFAEQYSKR
jgi:hypothetical protein